MSEDYVEVRDEPRHRRRFENEFVRMYDVLVPSGDTTMYHHHTEDTFYVSVNEATVRDQRWGSDEARTGVAPAGLALCRTHRSKPLIHQVSNVGDGEMRMIGAEIKRSPAVTSADPLEAPGHELGLEREQLRAYDLTLDSGASTGDIEYRFSSLTVVLVIASVLVRSGNGSERTMVYAPGDVIWQPGPVEFSLTNVGETPFKAVMGEWR
jgi:hypothetical protein